MYVIVTYDISDEQRLNKVRKILRKYLHWVQNSVFEGEITKSSLERCKMEILEVIDRNEDSVYFYLVKMYRKNVLGITRNPTDNIV